MRMPSKDDICSPINHFMVKGHLLFCRLQLVLYPHLRHNNRDICFLFRPLNLGPHLFFIQIGQAIVIVFLTEQPFHAIITIGVSQQCNLNAFNVLYQEWCLTAAFVRINTDGSDSLFFKSLSCSENSLQARV